MPPLERGGTKGLDFGGEKGRVQMKCSKWDWVRKARGSKRDGRRVRSGG